MGKLDDIFVGDNNIDMSEKSKIAAPKSDSRHTNCIHDSRTIPIANRHHIYETRNSIKFIDFNNTFMELRVPAKVV